MEIYQPTLPTEYKGANTVYVKQVNHSKELIGFYAYSIKECAYREDTPYQPLVAIFHIKPKNIQP